MTDTRAKVPPARTPETESWGELVKTVIYAGLIALFIRTFLFQPFNIPSGSMENTLMIGDYLFVEKFAYGYSRYSFPFGAWPFGRLFHGRSFASEPQRGDVIVFKFPGDNSTDFIKRVIGLPGDRVQMINDILYLNGKPIPRTRIADFVGPLDGVDGSWPQYRETLPGGKSYVIIDKEPDGPNDNTDIFVVPPGHYFMMGDNRDNSADSRTEVGYVPAENLEGKAVIKFFSINGSAQIWQIWKWPWAVRYDRILRPRLSDEPLEARLGHLFRNEALLRRALTHSSADARLSNERLEFLGDRVLAIVIAEKLHALYPDDAEGALALKFNALARAEACTRAAEAAGLGSHIRLAGSESESGGRGKSAILSGACEAVIAALYLDGGFEIARAFVEKYWTDEFAALHSGREMRDAKTRLQEWAQARGKAGSAPVYRETARTGPDHAPQFSVEAVIVGEPPEPGHGRSKREAEQDAAARMLARLGLH